jgi:hypothetical protein
MKPILFIFSTLVVAFFGSCKKETITPGNYVISQPKPDSSNWQNQFNNGGTVPTWGTGNNNPAVGTTWVLTYMKVGFTTPPLPADTIRFIDNTNYTINGGANRPYQLTNGVSLSSLTLTLNYHYPFGSGNYTAEIATTFVTDAVILNAQFRNINSTTTMVLASFRKI